jgi:hypothetical protein
VEPGPDRSLHGSALPLKPPGGKVHLYDGSLKRRQDVQGAVIDMTVGTGPAAMRGRGDAVG